MIEATILGVAEAEALLTKLQSGVQTVASGQVAVATDVVYAWGMEFGEYRNGKLARAAGGSFALTGGFQAVLPSYEAVLPLALLGGEAAVRLAMLKAAADIQAQAAQRAPRDTGTLANSYQIVPGFK